MIPTTAQTGTGAHVDIVNLAPGDIHIFDIARALSRTARWNGWTATENALSVAEHSIRVSWLCESFCPKYALAGLMHDAPEAYTGDIITPLKRRLPEFRAVEDAIARAVALRFDLPHPLPREVKEMDALALAWEGRDLMKPPVATAQADHMFFRTGIGRTAHPQPISATAAYDHFLERFAELAGDPTPPEAVA